MTTTQADTTLPTSSKVLCAAYGVIAIAALIATWSQNVAYFNNLGGFLHNVGNDLKVTPASRSFTVDIALFLLAAAILMVIEARKHDVKFVWAYIIGGLLIAISVTFPLFLIAREIRVSRTDPTRLGTGDTIALTLLALFTAAFVIWIDVM